VEGVLPPSAAAAAAAAPSAAKVLARGPLGLGEVG